MKKKPLEPLISMHDLKNVVAGLVAVPKPKAKRKLVRRSSPKKGKK